MVLLECKTEKRNSQLTVNTDSQWSEQACFARATQVCLAVNHNTSVTSCDEFDVQSELHGQVSLAAVNQILCHS